MQIHIAILDCDVPIPAVYSKRGLYSTQFRALLRAAASRLNAAGWAPNPVDIQTLAFDVVGGCFPPYEWLRSSPNRANGNGNSGSSQASAKDRPAPIDAILITGSAASAYDTANNPWIQPLQDFVQTVYAHYPAVKIFGSCFGHQIVAQALLHPTQCHPHPEGQSRQMPQTGLTVEACPDGYEIGLLPITLNGGFISAFPRLAQYLRSKPPGQEPTLKIQLIHADRVVYASPTGAGSLPPGWINMGHTVLAPIHGLFNPHRVLTYQGHFEFDVFVNRETVHAFASKGGWPAERVERYVRQVEVGGGDDDSEVAAELVVLFLADGTY